MEFTRALKRLPRLEAKRQRRWPAELVQPVESELKVGFRGGVKGGGRERERRVVIDAGAEAVGGDEAALPN